MNNYMDTAGNYSGIGTNKLLGKSFIWMFISVANVGLYFECGNIF